MTLHCVESPAATVADRQETIDGVACAATLNMTILLVEPKLAIMTAEPVRLDAVEKPKLVLLLPLKIVADVGTMSPELVDVRLTDVGIPGLVRVMVQVPPEPGVTVAGLQTAEERPGAGSMDNVVVFDDEASDAVTTADPAEVTLPALAVKDAVVAVARTATETGTVRDALLEARATVVPPEGAGPDRVTVQAVLVLAARLGAVQVREVRLTEAIKEMLTGTEFPLREAVIVALPAVVIVPTDTVNVAVVEAAGTAKEAGMLSIGLLEVSATGRPPAGAALDRVRLQEVLALEARPGTAQVREVTLTGPPIRAMVTGTELLPMDAVTVALAFDVTVLVVALKDAAVAEVGTITEAGTVRDTLLEANATVLPPVRAGFDSVTVQEVLALEARLGALQFKEVRLIGPVRAIVTGTELPLREAVTVALALEVTVPAVAVKDAVVAVTRTVTEAGTVRVALFEAKVTMVPPVGAGFDSVTVQEVLALAARLEAVQVREVRLTGPNKEILTGTELPLREAVRVALALEVTLPAVAVKEAVVAVARTVTEAGTVRVALLEARVTTVPPVGAGFDSVTVQEVLALEARLEAVQVREVRLTGPNKEMLTGIELPLREAVTVALALEVTVPVVAVKEAVVAVASTVTEAGTVKVALLEARVTTVPPVGAGFDSVTVQGVLALEARLGAVQVREVRLTGPNKEILTGTELPLREAVTVALALVVTVPAVEVKDAVVAVARTVTEAGTVRVALFEARVTTVPPVGAGFDSATVQEVLALEARLEAVQVREVRLTGPSSEMLTGTELPLRAAVTVALALEVTLPAVAVKEAVVAVAMTVTEAGAVRVALLEARVTTVPPVGAGFDSVTVQEVLALEARLEAVQVREVRLTGPNKEMLTGTELPLREAVRVALALVVTVPVVAVKEAVVAVASTVTEAGTVKVALFEAKVTTVPPVGAGFDSVTVQGVLALEARLGAVQVREVRLTGPNKEMLTGTELPLREAVTVALALVVTVPVVAVKDAVVAVARTVTEAGTVRVALFEAKVTTVPPVGAGFDSVTVQGVLALEARLEAVQVREVRLTGPSSEMLIGTELPLREAVRVALALVVTVPVVAVKDAVVAVARTVTEAGTVRVALFEAKVTTVPPVGAGFDSVTVQGVLALEARLGAVQVREVRLTGPNKEMLTGTELPLREAVTVALALEVTLPAVAVKEAVVALAMTVTEAGTVSAALLDARDTMVPLAGAGLDSVTVQEVLALEARLGAVQVREVRLAAPNREILKGNEFPLKEALMVAVPEEVMVPTEAVNVAAVEEAGTAKEGGMLSIGLLEVSATAVPPAGAALDSVTVQEVVPFEVRLEGAHVREEGPAAGASDSVADAEEPLKVAVTVPL